MSDDETDALGYLNQAQQALARRDREQARRWAALAAELDPKLEESWLILAAISEPDDSIRYLKRALDVNPTSQRARKGMHWAIERKRTLKAQVVSAPLSGVQTQPVQIKRSPGGPVETAPIKIRSSRPAPKVPRLAFTLLPVMVILVLLGIGFFALSGFSPSWTVFANSSNAERPIGVLFKPSLTPSSTPTHTPTSTPTSTSTPTPTPTYTPTLTPTETPTDTPTPEPTWTPEPTEVYIEPEEPVYAGNGERWIDVDLTNQRLYAYEGNQVVNSFVVSTGTWEHPTVTGSYQIYVKYSSADMAGPGYYLPDVPYVMYFYKGYGLHGTYWHNNFGTPMSHGCVNLTTSDAGWLFNWASVGTTVNVHY